MRKITVVAAAACFSALFTFAAAGAAEDENAKIVRFAGKAEVYQWGMWHEAKEGMEVRPGESVRVVGKGEITVEAANGRVQVTGKDDTTLVNNGMVDTRIAPWKSSRLAKDPEYRAADEAPTVRQFYCPEGEVSVDAQTGERLSLVTPLITASVRGTVFSMRVDDDANTDIFVARGQVDAVSRITGKNEIYPCGMVKLSSEKFKARLRCHAICLPEGADWREYDYDVFEALDEYMYSQMQ